MSESTHALRPWKVLDRHLLLSAPPWMSIYRERVQLPSDRVVDDFYRIVLPEFAAVVPITDAGEFVLVRGYKHGPGRVTLSSPAGMISAGESPLQAAQRELLEETGYEASDWKSLGSFVADGNRQCGTMHLFVARGARRTQPVIPDDTEVLHVELLTPRQVREALRDGQFANMAGALSVSLALALS